MTLNIRRQLLFALFIGLGAVLALPQESFAATIFSDDFTDTDGTSITTHNNQWTIEDTGSGEIQDNTLSGRGFFALNSISSENQCVSTDVLFPIPSIIQLYNQRHGTNGNYWYAYITADGTTEIGRGDGVGGPFGYAGSQGLFPSAGWHNFKFCAIGDSATEPVVLTSYLDGNVLHTYDGDTGGIGVGGLGPGTPAILLGGQGVTWTIDNALIEEIPADPVTATFSASADTYVRSGQANRNVGAGQYMQVQSSGDNRSLVKFDQNAIASAVGSGDVLSAKLRLTITDNGNNWGSTGRTVDVHRLITSWTEGNGTELIRGTGAGATWNCAIDSQIVNLLKDCSGSSEWEMGQPNNPSIHPWIASPTATQTITNNQTGVIEYDVTADVQGFMSGTSNYGWIIRKTNEGQSGSVQFGTKESSSTPQLVITYQP